LSNTNLCELKRGKKVGWSMFKRGKNKGKSELKKKRKFESLGDTKPIQKLGGKLTRGIRGKRKRAGGVKN